MLKDKYLAQRQILNSVRYVAANKSLGHYESYFLRANHPTKAIAFWFRYTIFSPKEGVENNPVNSLGELWAVVFDQEKDKIIAVKKEVPLEQCFFSAEGLDVKISDFGFLQPGYTKGSVSTTTNSISWQLNYSTQQPPLKLLPEKFYTTSFPKAKVLVASPMAIFSGTITVNSETYLVENWIGSENHNWGSKHTDEYAWGQVAGFDNAPSAFLECATARVKAGPFKTPWMTTLVLRDGEKEYLMNSLWQAVKAKASYQFFHWQFDCRSKGTRIRGEIQATKESFIALNYYNPPGGSNTCLNSKIASCKLLLEEPGKPDRVFETQYRAAFEILTTTSSHTSQVVV